MIYDKVLKIIYIGKTVESIRYFKSLIKDNEQYRLDDCYLFSDDYRERIINNDVDCVVIDLNIDDCEDIKFIRYLKTVDMYVVAFSSKEVGDYVLNKVNIDLDYISFLDSSSSDVQVNNFFSVISNNKIEFNVEDFFDCYINDNPIYFDDEELEKFIAYLTCRRKRINSYEEIVEAIFPKIESDIERRIHYRGLCSKLSEFFRQANLPYLFAYTSDKCLFNYHLVCSDFYYYVENPELEFNCDFVDTINCNFLSLIEHDSDNRSLAAALDFDELHYDEEVYIPLLDEDIEDAFNIVQEEKEVAFEESFLDKAMKKK